MKRQAGWSLVVLAVLMTAVSSVMRGPIEPVRAQEPAAVEVVEPAAVEEYTGGVRRLTDAEHDAALLQLGEFEDAVVVLEIRRDASGAVMSVHELANYPLAEKLNRIEAKQDLILARLDEQDEGPAGPTVPPVETVGVDINSASYDELLTIGGIGPVKAGAIIAERDASGRGLFVDWADLQRRVSGIGPATLADIRASGASLGQ